jgi:hypothetical protein
MHHYVNILAQRKQISETTIRRVFPIRQYIAYLFGITGAETEIHKIKDDSKIRREKNIDRRDQRHIMNVWHLPAPPPLSRYRLPLINSSIFFYFLSSQIFSLPHSHTDKKQKKGNSEGTASKSYMTNGLIIYD